MYEILMDGESCDIWNGVSGANPVMRKEAANISSEPYKLLSKYGSEKNNYTREDASSLDSTLIQLMIHEMSVTMSA
jgi:hypothetical protein